MTFFVVELYTNWLIAELNFLQDLVERFNRVIYFLAKCSIRVTAISEYLNPTLTTLSQMLCYNSAALSLILLNH